MLPNSYYIVAAQRRLLRRILKLQLPPFPPFQPYIINTNPNVASLTAESPVAVKRPKHKFRKSSLSIGEDFCTECWMYLSSLKTTEGCDPVYCLGKEQTPWPSHRKLSNEQRQELQASLTKDLDTKQNLNTDSPTSIETVKPAKRPKHKTVKSFIASDDAFCTECWLFRSAFNTTEGCDPVYCLGKESPWLAYLKLTNRPTGEPQPSSMECQAQPVKYLETKANHNVDEPTPIETVEIVERPKHKFRYS